MAFLVLYVLAVSAWIHVACARLDVQAEEIAAYKQYVNQSEAHVLSMWRNCSPQPQPPEE